MLEELRQELKNVSKELEQHYNKQKEFFHQVESTTTTNEPSLKIIRDDKSNNINVRLLASNLIVSQSCSLVLFSANTIGLNILTRMSIQLNQAMTAIANELSLLKEQKAKPIAEGKISEIENQLTNLNKDFRKYGPTLRKFKKALDQTEKVLRDNR